MKAFFQVPDCLLIQCPHKVEEGKGTFSLISIIKSLISFMRASLVAQTVKNWPTMRETWVQFLCQDDPLETGMATHSIILAWKIPWTEEPGGLQSMELQRVGHNRATNTLLHFQDLITSQRPYLLLPSY